MQRLQNSCRWDNWILSSAWLLIFSGFLHALMFLTANRFASVDLFGHGWEGPLSVRKPILFGISTGLTLVSFAWLIAVLEGKSYKRIDRLLGRLLAAVFLAEVLLVSVQFWRGERSHFNQSTFSDRCIDNFMFLAIAVAFGIMGYFTWRTFWKIRLSMDQRIGIRFGMVFLIASCLIGFAISVHGYRQVAVGADPSLVGSGGVAVFPHGVAIHAIQVLPLFGWIMQRAGVQESSRSKAMLQLATAFAFFLTYALIQTLQGLGRFEWNPVSFPMFGGTLIMLILAAWHPFSNRRRMKGMESGDLRKGMKSQ